jgi:hypothetical protein
MMALSLFYPQPTIASLPMRTRVYTTAARVNSHPHMGILRGRSRLFPLRGWCICCSSQVLR